MTDAPAADQAAAAPARRRRGVRVTVERVFLGSIMTVMAILLDRRLRRVFSKR